LSLERTWDGRKRRPELGLIQDSYELIKGVDMQLSKDMSSTSRRDDSAHLNVRKAFREFFEPLLFVPLIISTLTFIVSYCLNVNMIIDERGYAIQSCQFYKGREFPRNYPLLSILTWVPLEVFGIAKQSFVVVPFAATLLTTVLVYRLSLRQFKSRGRAVLSSVLMASNPLLIWLSAKHMTETLFTLFLILTFLIVSKEAVSRTEASLAGIFSSLAYLSRYPGILLFPFVTFYMIKRKIDRRNIPFYLMSALLVIVYWLFNRLIFGEYFTTETYSIGYIFEKTGAMTFSLDLFLLRNMVYKAVAGASLLLGYTAIFLSPRIRRIFSTRILADPIIAFVIFYSVVHLGYYAILSMSWGVAFSIDHFARYFLPIAPLIIAFSDSPFKNNRLTFFFTSLSCAAGIMLGFYLTQYSNIHSLAPMSWTEFLERLVA